MLMDSRSFLVVPNTVSVKAGDTVTFEWHHDKYAPGRKYARSTNPDTASL